MNGKQQVVMWSGIILIILRFFTTDQFSIIWGEIISGPNPGKILGKVPDNFTPTGGGTGSVLGGPMTNGGNPGSGYLQA